MKGIKIGKVGKIIEGDEAGKFVKVVDDSVNTGGFLILTADDIGFTRGFDNWVENESMLQRYFQEARWRVEWPD